MWLRFINGTSSDRNKLIRHSVTANSVWNFFIDSERFSMVFPLWWICDGQISPWCRHTEPSLMNESLGTCCARNDLMQTLLAESSNEWIVHAANFTWAKCVTHQMTTETIYEIIVWRSHIHRNTHDLPENAKIHMQFRWHRMNPTQCNMFEPFVKHRENTFIVTSWQNYIISVLPSNYLK